MDLKLEGDGIIENFYNLVWQKQTKDQGYRGFLLPDTILYKHQQPRAWYFSNKEGCVKKKLKEKLNAQSIEKAFLARVSKSKIVASYIYISKNGREIEYFELEEFKHFIYNRPKTHDGVLQKFIDPKGRRNSAIQMVWTPHLCIFEMRENQNDLYDQRLNLYERVITYEGDQHQSQIKPFKSMELRSFMQEVGEALVEHFSIISEGQSKPTRMVLVFKKDSFNRPWLLLCTSIRCSSASPINISCNTKFPSVINVKRAASNPRNLLNIQKKVLCKSCDTACEIDRMHEIRYKSVINFKDGRIPVIIQKNHPNLALREYLSLRLDDGFLNKIALVCDSCFLMYLNEPEILRPEKKSFTTRSITPLTTDRSRIRTPLKLNDTQKSLPKPTYPEIPALKFTRSRAFLVFSKNNTCTK